MQIASIRVLERRHCGFVTYEARSSAEKAAEELQNRLIVRGSRCKLMWGRPQQERNSESAPPVPTNMLPPQVCLCTCHAFPKQSALGTTRLDSMLESKHFVIPHGLGRLRFFLSGVCFSRIYQPMHHPRCKTGTCDIVLHGLVW